DNGSEFADSKGIEFSPDGSRRLYAYYCHPYTSCERGSNENANKIIRRFFPKGKSLEKCTSKDCKRVMDYMNNLPRKVLGYRTAAELFQSCLDALPPKKF
ncbi:MAG: IS30 family transposase, partial [Clostridiaceae bacterium]|nr:IS30 family transposase [Clostridiaceae bacterium]